MGLFNPINAVAVITAVIASFILGFAWHGPLFGKIWIQLMNIPEGTRPSTVGMIKSIAINLLGTFLLTLVIFYSINIWRLSYSSISKTDADFFIYGSMIGVFNWLGFMVPMLLIGVAWEGKSWKLFGFNAAYHLANSLLITMILAAWPR